jgi:hypothetical protein
LPTQRRWIENACASGRELVVEPWLEREVDFSVQLEMTGRGLRLCGYTGLINDRKGQFLANWAAPNHGQRLPDRVVTRFEEPRNISVLLHESFRQIFSLLEAELREAEYIGPLGIDCFVYRTRDGECRLKPIVEINPRYTMGRVTLELMKLTCPGSHGLFRLFNRTAARAAGYEHLAAFADALRSRCPLKLEGEPHLRIREGTICLNDPTQAGGVLAVFEVARKPVWQCTATALTSVKTTEQPA